MGVEIYPGFPAAEVLFDENGAVEAWQQEIWALAKMAKNRRLYAWHGSYRHQTIFAEVVVDILPKGCLNALG